MPEVIKKPEETKRKCPICGTKSGSEVCPQCGHPFRPSD